VGGGVTIGPEAVEGGALVLGAGAGAGPGLEEGAGAGTVETGRRPAQPATKSATMHPRVSQPERKNAIDLADLRSIT
jgi:hypothetical protein